MEKKAAKRDDWDASTTVGDKEEVNEVDFLLVVEGTAKRKRRSGKVNQGGLGEKKEKESGSG